MYIKIVEFVCVLEFIVMPAEKRGVFILFSRVQVAPAKIWFNIMHNEEGQFEHAPANFRKGTVFVKTLEQDIYKIVVTGPESSGKTLLASDLAAALQLRWTPEFARYYVAHLGRPYVHEDLKTIYRGQQSWEKWHIEKVKNEMEAPYSTLPALVCDTDWTVVRIWEKYVFKTPSILPITDWELAKNTLYLLCSPDFPWQPDPLREHPEERWQLFELYQELLLERNLPHLLLQGDHASRLETGIAEVRKFSAPLQP